MSQNVYANFMDRCKLELPIEVTVHALKEEAKDKESGVEDE